MDQRPDQRMMKLRMSQYHRFERGSNIQSSILGLSHKSSICSVASNGWYYRLNAKAEEVVKEEIEEVVDPANEELLSIRKLMARQDAANVLINDAREYQIELFERAKKQNIVAVLDTGQSLLPHRSSRSFY